MAADTHTFDQTANLQGSGTPEDAGRWCYLLDPRCRGQLVLAEEPRPSGMRMRSAGLVPYDEYRLATDEEIADRLR